ASGSGATPEGGTFSCSGTSCTYTPPANFSGSDSFDYTVSDGTETDTGTVSVTVNPVNDGPTCSNESGTTPEGFQLSDSVVCSDQEADSLTYSKASNPSHGSLTFNSDGTFTYTPDANYNGPDSFTFKANDGTASSNVATYSITVSAGNDAPTAADDSASTDEDTSTSIDVTDNDTDVDEVDNLTASGSGATDQGGTFSCSNDSCSYTPPTNFSGTDSFGYTVSDGNGGSDTGTVTMTVDRVNDGPDAVDDTDSTSEDNAVVTVVVATDTDEDDDDLVITAFTQGAYGWVTCDSAGGTCTYTPVTNFNGSDSYTYTISDDDYSDTATVTISVAAVNDAPVVSDDAASTDEDTSVAVNVLANDSDIDRDDLDISSYTGSGAGSVLCDSESGDCTYTPAPNFSGTDSFDYTVSDGNGGSDTGTVTVTVNAVDDGQPGGSTNPPPGETPPPPGETPPPPGETPPPPGETPPPAGDTTPPSAQAAADTTIISPNGDGRLDAVHVDGSFDETTTWRFTITPAGASASSDSGPIFTRTGVGHEIDVEWDGRSSSGRVVPDGEYVWRIEGQDVAGNDMAPVSGYIEVDRTAVVFSGIEADPNPFHLKEQDVTAIRYSVAEAARVRVKIKKRGRIVRAFKVHRFLEEGSAVLVWSGRNRHGERVRSGRYVVVLRATDLAKNVTVNRALSIWVKR
ncbi:MAG: cadherin-like domain-containing protein, partial [Actinomycetota bacterium]|nr:cadherin-like domain-containing protein [Actinomycetota bacterium]